MLIRSLAMVLATAGFLVPVWGAPSASATPDNFTPRSGPTFNSPLGGPRQQRAIFRKIIRSINSSPRGSEINIFSWNFLTSEGKDALLRADRRGVRVRVLMDDNNLFTVGNPPFRSLRAGLRRNSKGDRKGQRSWARVCTGTCRGGSGAAHSKFFMFSHPGRAKRVVMLGSANFTQAASRNQWNDIYTHRGNRKVWKFTRQVFREASRDKRARRPFARLNAKKFELFMFPQTGKRSVDPVMKVLRRVSCHGARNTPTGRTRIRIAPDVVRNARGMALGRKVRSLWNNGCDIRLGYTVMGIDVGRMLRSDGPRGPVPLKHLVQDLDGDGQFDTYFHMKSMTVVGHYGKDRAGYALLNGSANWSGLAKVSDENVGIYRAPGRVQRYQEHIQFWYDNFPSVGNRNARSTGSAAPPVEEDRLIFGTGEDAVYENGESVSDGDFDPFAQVDLD